MQRGCQSAKAVTHGEHRGAANGSSFRTRSQPSARVAGNSSTPPPARGAGGALVSSGARSGGGVAGGDTGSRSQPLHGPAMEAVSSVASAKRVIGRSRLVAGWRPRPSLYDEGLLQLAHCCALAERLVIGVYPAAGTALGSTVGAVAVSFGRLIVHHGHLISPRTGRAKLVPTVLAS
jgi:hypothetical protein